MSIDLWYGNKEATFIIRVLFIIVFLIPTGTAYWLFKEIPLLLKHSEYDVARNCIFFSLHCEALKFVQQLHNSHTRIDFFLWNWLMWNDIIKAIPQGTPLLDVNLHNHLKTWLCLKSNGNFIDYCNTMFMSVFQGRKISSFRGYWMGFDWSQFPHSYMHKI